MDWQQTDKGLYKKFTFADFTEAFAFMVRVAELAEEANHHPTWTNRDMADQPFRRRSDY
jgi:4a-hydroxytetrahydrobiopterin dehydratase